jgi:hypothetical protein
MPYGRRYTWRRTRLGSLRATRRDQTAPQRPCFATFRRFFAFGVRLYAHKLNDATWTNVGDHDSSIGDSSRVATIPVMTILLPAIAATFAAFCIWLIVRIVNRRKRWERWEILSALALSGILLLGFTVNLLYIPQPWVKLDPARLSELAKGMRQADVEKLLGGPPGFYGNPKLSGSPSSLEPYFCPPGTTEKEWFDDRNCFQLCFDPTDHLVEWHKRALYRRDYRLPWWRQKIRELTGL